MFSHRSECGHLSYYSAFMLGHTLALSHFALMTISEHLSLMVTGYTTYYHSIFGHFSAQSSAVLTVTFFFVTSQEPINLNVVPSVVLQ